MIRIANGQGFWGDSLQAPLDQIRRGPIDYLTLDYLAEVTMSILQKQRSRDPRSGYARDFPTFIAEAAKDVVEQRVKIIANAGGVNHEGCRDAVRAALERNSPGQSVRIGVVKGDDILQRLHELTTGGIELNNLDNGEPLAPILDRVQSANVYL